MAGSLRKLHPPQEVLEAGHSRMCLDNCPIPAEPRHNKFLSVDFQGSRVTSDGGLILVRELDERLGMGGPEHTKEVIRTAKTSRDSPQSRPWRGELGTRGCLAYDCAQR